MPRPKTLFRQYRKHSTQDCGFISIKGKRIYFPGRFGSQESLRAYHRTLAEWQAENCPEMPAAPSSEITVLELLARYWEFAERHYQKNGKPTKELDNVRHALRPVNRLYADTKVADFGPLCLKALQNVMIEDGLCRTVINSRIGKIRRMFRWAVSEEIAPPSLCHALDAVDGLRKGRTKARESVRVRPVSDAVIAATLQHLSPTVSDMVQFQRLTGCRPSEVCDLRPCDVNRGKEVWTYEPASHKNEHYDRPRIIAIGPKARSILTPYLLRDAQAYCFSPREAVEKRRAELRAKRKSKVQPSQVDRSKKKPIKLPGDRYTRMSYLYAIRRACMRAFPVPKGLPSTDAKAWRDEHWWSPNQLRHTAATEIRRQFGLEAAQAALGHSRADVTQIYAERDLALAAQVAMQLG